MRAVVPMLAALVLFGCTPATYIYLYNATGDEITIALEKSQRVVTIPPGAAADFSPVYIPGEHVVIRTSKRSWIYSPQNLFPPRSFYEQHVMVMRAFARIDSRGYIYLLSPPADHGAPRECPQPAGFPVKPQKT